MNYCYLDSPIGPLLIAGDENAVRCIEFPKNGKARRPEPGWKESMRGPVSEAVRQLREYFAGVRTEFDLPLAPEGTEFQRTVWKALREVPCGQTWSYGQLAKHIGRPSAVRAVGLALHGLWRLHGRRRPVLEGS